MKNIEKYQNELKVLGTYFRVTREGLLKKCDGKCKYCVFNTSGCGIKRIEWLLQECKEPILNEEGKEFLKQLIEPFISNEIVSVCKNEDLQILRIDYKIGWTCYSKKVLGKKWDWFKNLDSESCYTSKDLGL